MMNNRSIITRVKALLQTRYHRTSKRKLEDTVKEPNKSSRYDTRATTRATTIEGEVDCATDPRKGNSSNNNEGRAMLQKALDLLGEYRAFEI